MTSPHVRTARRNAVVIAASGLAGGALFLYPTSLHSPVGTRRVTAPPGIVAPVGVVSPPVPAQTGPLAASSLPVLTVNGAVVDTPYGPVQVRITARAGRLESAVAIAYPRAGARDREINGIAIPLLQQETLTAAGGRVDTVSGATFTSDGYRQSLQAALDAAHLR